VTIQHKPSARRCDGQAAELGASAMSARLDPFRRWPRPQGVAGLAMARWSGASAWRPPVHARPR